MENRCRRRDGCTKMQQREKLFLRDKPFVFVLLRILCTRGRTSRREPIVSGHSWELTFTDPGSGNAYARKLFHFQPSGFVTYSFFTGVVHVA